MNRNNKGQFVKRQSGELFEGHKVWYDHKGYACIYLDGKDVKLHIYVWERVNGIKPTGFDIHHIDHNKSNYALDNLQLLSSSDHQKTHAGWVKESGEWAKKPCNACRRILSLDCFYPRKGHTPSSLCRECSKQYFKQKNIEKGGKSKRYILPNQNNEYQCSVCLLWKPESDFPKRKGGVGSYCKSCVNARQKQRRRQNAVSESF